MHPAVMSILIEHLLRMTCAALQELALDLPGYSDEPLLGAPSSILIVSDLGLKRLYSILSSAKLERKLVSDTQRILAILAGNSSCLMQHAHDRLSSLVERVAVA
jgi:hypothetical protein